MPRSFLKPSGNLLVILEEENGNPLGISLDTVSRARACARVSESHLPPVSSWLVKKQRRRKNNTHHSHKTAPFVQLSCPPGKSISKILFASYGTPSGNCKSYAQGSCHASNSKTVLEQVRVLLLFTKFYGCWSFESKNFKLIQDESLSMSCYIIYMHIDLDIWLCNVKIFRLVWGRGVVLSQ